MIRLIEAKNYKCLRYISQSLESFQVLIGPNSSGKSTFMDVPCFISDLISMGIDEAIYSRTSNYSDLTFSNNGEPIEFALELDIPKNIIEKLGSNPPDTIRYEIRILFNEDNNELKIDEENVTLLKFSDKFPKTNGKAERVGFPENISEPVSILNQNYNDPARLVFHKSDGKIDVFKSEIIDGNNGGAIQLPETDSFKFSVFDIVTSYNSILPATNWLKSYLTNDLQKFILDTQKMRASSSAGQSQKLEPDGSNLPWLIEELKKDRKRYDMWVSHIQLALPEIKDIKVITRSSDRFKYLRIKYENGIEVPSRLLSEGTLKIMALTLPAYLTGYSGVLFYENPENGIHPKDIEIIFQSLISVYNAQVIIATQSSSFVSLLKSKTILCFAKTKEGKTDIVSGTNHPNLKNWNGEVNISLLYAGGVLG